MRARRNWNACTMRLKRKKLSHRLSHLMRAEMSVSRLNLAQVSCRVAAWGTMKKTMFTTCRAAPH
jgi:hypothetical protein